MTYTFPDKEFGTILVTLRRGMRNVIVKCIDNQVKVSAPPQCPDKFILAHIDSNRELIRRMLAKDSINRLPRYFDGQTIKCIGFDIFINSDKSVIDNTPPAYYQIIVSKAADLSRREAVVSISNLIKNALKLRFHYLMDFAYSVADELKINGVEKIVMGRGMRKLGHCTIHGEIQLSYVILLLPRHLARYVICHELAHLVHPNHSPQFHTLCNDYVDGKEKELENELKHFVWPLLR